MFFLRQKSFFKTIGLIKTVLSKGSTGILLAVKGIDQCGQCWLLRGGIVWLKTLEQIFKTFLVNICNFFRAKDLKGILDSNYPNNVQDNKNIYGYNEKEVNYLLE